MNGFTNEDENQGLHVKLWRGERMALIGMDVDQPEPDFVGFSIEVKSPGSPDFMPLRNRLAFSYAKSVAEVNGYRNFDSTKAPFQKFRWIHFPYNPTNGLYTYRITKKHMPQDNQLKNGASVTLTIPLDPVTYADYLDVGFTRNFASSQAYVDKFHNDKNVIPAKADDGLNFNKAAFGNEVYDWLGFEAYALIKDFLTEAVADQTLSLDVFAYDLNEPDIIDQLQKLGGRLRIIIDNSGSHGAEGSAENQAADKLNKAQVKRMHFHNLQHNKVLIAKRGGSAFKVLFGSTNFSFRGLYIQANNVVVAYGNDAAGLFEKAFELAFSSPGTFEHEPISTGWHVVGGNGKPAMQFSFSPHSDSNLSLNPVGAAIDSATSSVFFSIAFLNQIKSGPTRAAIDRLMERKIFSYGIVDNIEGLEVKKPDGSIGMVDFEYLAKHAPEPFKTEWSGGSGIHQHHKFVVTDFNLASAKVFTGSSNLAPSGETGNGDNLVLIEDQKVATSYAIEALRAFDHLHFRSRLQDAQTKNGDPLTLKKPMAISQKPAWFEDAFLAGSQAEADRLLFAH